MTDYDPIITTFFAVTIDGMDIGYWTEVELGGVEVEVEARPEGGNQSFVPHLTGRLTYQNLRLTRQVNADTSKVAQWFTGMAGVVQPSTGQISALRNDRTPAMQWTFTGAVPVRWSLPSFSVDQAKAAVEVLEIAHQGFTF